MYEEVKETCVVCDTKKNLEQCLKCDVWVCDKHYDEHMEEHLIDFLDED